MLRIGDVIETKPYVTYNGKTRIDRYEIVGYDGYRAKCLVNSDPEVQGVRMDYLEIILDNGTAKKVKAA